MQTQIIIFLFILNVFCLIAIAMLNKWNRQQDEDLLDYGSVSNQQYVQLYEEMVQERNKLLDIVEKNERKTEMLIDFIVDSMNEKQNNLFHLYRKRYDVVTKRSEVFRRLEKIKFSFDFESIERQSLYTLKEKLDREDFELTNEIVKLQKEINA